jgi:hypothetical protein
MAGAKMGYNAPGEERTYLNFLLIIVCVSALLCVFNVIFIPFRTSSQVSGDRVTAYASAGSVRFDGEVHTVQSSATTRSEICLGICYCLVQNGIQASIG